MRRFGVVLCCGHREGILGGFGTAVCVFAYFNVI